MSKEEIGEFLYKIHQSIVDLVEKTDRMSVEIRAIGCENAKLKKELEDVRDRMARRDEMLKNVQDKLENMDSDRDSDVKVLLHPPHSDNDSEKSFDDEFLGVNRDLSWKKLGPQGPYLLSFDKSDDEKSEARFGHCITKRMLSTQFETPDDSDDSETPRRNKKSESEAEMKILNKKLLLKNDIRRQSAPTLTLRPRDTSPVNINHGLTKKNENKNLLAQRLGIEEELERVKMKLSETDLTKISPRLSAVRKDDLRRQSSPNLSTEGSNILSVRRKTTKARNGLVEERRKSINLSMHGVNDYKPEREDVFTNLAFKFGIGNELLNAQRKLSEPNLIENHYKGTLNESHLTVPEINRRNSTDLSMISTKSNFLTLRQKFLDDIAEKNRERFTSEPNLIANIRGISNRKQLTVPEINRRKSTDLSTYSPKVEVERKISEPVLLNEEKPKRKRKLSKNIAHQIANFIKGDTDGESGSRESLVERKMQPSPPIKTTTYKVEATDTLTSVAARFDTTPSELAKLNKLVSRTVFPGQVIRVPDNSAKKLREGDEDGDGTSQTASMERSENTDEEDMLDTLRVNSPKPGHIERIGTPSSPHLEKFLRINVRHITDGQGVVSGTLIVTPNALMFDPNVSDPLVIERGPEAYGVIAPMDYVVNAAIYNDIAHMRVGHHEENKKLPKPEVYHMKSEESEGEGDASCLLSTDQGDSRDLSAKETLADLRSSTEEEDGWYGGAQREGDAFPKAFERDLVTPTNSTIDKLSDNQDTTAEDKSPLEDDRGDAEALVKATEERRRSCLDHHWAVPKHSIDNSLEREESVQEAEGGQEPVLVDEGRRGSEGHLVKLSCHDSGIDIRDPPPSVPVIPKKTVYSDADILLAGDGEFLPPKPVKPLEPTISEDDKKKQSVSFSIEEEAKKEEDKQEPKKSKMLKRLSYPLSWVEGFTGSEDKDSLPSSADSHPSHTPSSVFSISKVFSRRSSVGTYIKPKLDYRSMVSVDDMPELFVSFDKLIPRPARSCEDPPLYLRLRMGKPKGKKLPRSSAIMSYGKKRMRPEYWFSVPREKVDELYKFLTTFAGHLYGDLDEEEVAARGYEFVDSDTELFDEEEGNGNGRRASQDGDLANLTKESWEVLSMSGELRRALYASSVASLDLELFLPDLNGQTEILSEDHRKQLCRHLPARAEGYVWTLVFSTSTHGFSLNSMYRKMTRLESPILMVIQDTDNNVFGALTSCSFKVSDHFYGTGESLLFRFHPDIQVYNWTGENMFFIKGNNESLSIGAGDGKFGLWLDGDLNQGRSEPCATYGNEPLSPQQDFVVKTIECWAFF